MEKLKFGEIAVLEDGKEYICFSQLNSQGIDYVYLMSNFKPLDVKFAKQSIDGEELKLELVEDQEEKQRLLELFQKQFSKNE